MNTPADTDKVKVIIVTGMSGAGKSTVLKALEDVGYYCVDNLPVFLLADLLRETTKGPHRRLRLALCMDIRDERFIASLETVFSELQKKPFAGEVLFLETEDAVLVRRYSQMRRRHPLAGEGTVLEGLARERERLALLKEKADHVLDTSSLTPHELRKTILVRYSESEAGDSMRISLVSFGYKYGPPLDADMVLDVRFLPNPYFVPELKDHTGLEPQVASFVNDNESARQFLTHVTRFLEFLIPQYRNEGKVSFTIGVGCTGGKHRSVATVEEIRRIMTDCGETVTITHRDITRE